MQLEVDQARAIASNLSDSLACYLVAPQQLKGPATKSTQAFKIYILLNNQDAALCISGAHCGKSWEDGVRKVQEGQNGWEGQEGQEGWET